MCVTISGKVFRSTCMIIMLFIVIRLYSKVKNTFCGSVLIYEHPFSVAENVGYSLLPSAAHMLLPVLQ